MRDDEFSARMEEKGLGTDFLPEAQGQTETETPPEEAPPSEEPEPTPQAEPEEATPEGDAEEKLILGKFKSQEELERAYENLESLEGRRGSELAELRQQVQALSQAQAYEQEQEAYYPPDEQSVEWAEQMVEGGQAGAAAVWALQNQPLLYDRIMDAWFESSPREASRFETAMMLDQQQHQFDSQNQPLRQLEQTEGFKQAWANVAQAHPDLEQVAQTIGELEAVAPALARDVLEGPDLPTRQRALENLYYLAKGRQADTAVEAATQQSRAQTEDIVAEKLAATVTGATSSPQGETSVDPLKAWKQNFLEPEPTSIWAEVKKAQ